MDRTYQVHFNRDDHSSRDHWDYRFYGGNHVVSGGKDLCGRDRSARFCQQSRSAFWRIMRVRRAILTI